MDLAQKPGRIGSGAAGLSIFLLFLWVQFFLALMPTWLAFPSYNYAWVALPLWCFLVFQRWTEIEVPWNFQTGGRVRSMFPFAVLLLSLPLFIIRPLEQVDQFWRLPIWLHAALVFSVTGLILVRGFGLKASKGLLQLSALALVLVPMPSVLEGAIAGNLTRIVTERVADLLPLTGYPIDQLGNAMLVKGAVLDVAEGCSGLRSFQASLMLGLFLGEFYRLPLVRRVILLGMALLLAMLGNGSRIYYLTTIAYRDGMEAEARVHGTAGALVVTFIYGGIGLLAWWFSTWKVGVRRKAGQRRVSA